MSEQNSEDQIKQLEARITTLEHHAAAADIICGKQAELAVKQVRNEALFIELLINNTEGQSKVTHAQMRLFLELEVRTGSVLKEIIRALPEDHREKMEHHIKSLSVLQDLIQHAEAEFAAAQNSHLEQLKKIRGNLPPPPPGQ